ncbi:MAG: hypothetical protein PHY12_00870 [Eubacteriales bacterium]|nr:hypothetical protein [Eubacteriales bacterium]
MKLNQTTLSGSFSEVPQGFDQAMRSAFAQIHRQEAAAHPPRRYARRLSFGTVLLILLLLAAMAAAAYHWKIFDAVSFMTGSAPKRADEVMQKELAQTTVNNVKITVQEAGYDGRTLFIRYSYRMLDVDTPLGMFAPQYEGTPNYGTEGVGLDELQLLTDRNVGWWIDQLWIDGQCVDMPNNSGSQTNGSPVPGELIQTEYWRLDNENVGLSGKVEVSLPIGERQPLEDYRLSEHPEKYDENGNLKLPEKGIVTFTVDTADTLARVRVEHPNVPLRLPDVTVQVSEVCYSPLTTYITLSLQGDADAIAAYKAENGEGYYDEDGKTLLWAYSGMDVYGGWVSNLMLVDGDGKPLFPDVYGNNGYGDDWAEYIYPAIENVPDELFLVPMDSETFHREEALRVK